jgi:hypothetical protein
LKFPFYLFLFSTLAHASISDWGINRRGNLTAKLTSYTEKEVPNIGQYARAEIEQTINIDENLIIKNQLRWTSNSQASDIATKLKLEKNDSHEVLLGDNFIKYKKNDFITQIGYQDVVWGEAFGFNYADIINPKDMRETLFADQAIARLPLFLFNGKELFPNGSFQILYSPEPRFSKALPLDLFIGDKFPQSEISVIKEKSPDLFKTSEAGGKLAYSFSDLDTAIFHYSYLDRDPSYSISQLTATRMILRETHIRLHSTGLSLTKTLGGHVLRTDIVYTKNKNINYIESNQLKNFEANTTNFLISLDTPSFHNYAGVFIFAESKLDKVRTNSTRTKIEQFSIVKMTKTFSDDQSLEFAYTHEFLASDNSIQTVLNWPLNNTLELKLGGQAYWGNADSNFSKYKKLNSVFFSLKNYFDL